MPTIIKRRKKKKKDDSTPVELSVPYEGAMGKSLSDNAAKKMWLSKASADELQLGYTMTQDSDGNFIVRTKLESKA